MTDYEERLRQLNLVLPEPPKPVGSYRPVIISDGIAYLSGQISKTASGEMLKGKVGLDLNLDQAQEAARAAALNVLSIIRLFIGFPAFDRILRVVGYVQVAPNFYDLSQVMNAASDLFLEIFGENGVHCRSSLGMASLPLNAAVEIEVTIKLKAVH